MPNHRIQIGIYCLDLDKANTASIGLYNYTKQLIQAISKPPQPDFDLTIILCETNKLDLIPAPLPEWIKIVTRQGTYSAGWRRLLADHFLSSRYARTLQLDAMHFPKGLAPLFFPGRIQIISTIADAIVFNYDHEFRDGMPFLRRKYFKWQTRRALNRAQSIITISEFSRRALSNIAPSNSHKIRTIYPGAGFPALDAAPKRSSNDIISIVVMGSLRPHKATHETLQLLAAFAETRRLSIKVDVVSIDQPDPSWLPLPTAISVTFHGRISDKSLSELIAKSCALVYLSKLEGFGLPCIEAYACGTPVCYRNTTSVAEIMHGIPCGWSGNTPEEFFAVLDQALKMDIKEIQQHRSALLCRFDWNIAAHQTAALYMDTFKPCRIPFGTLECSTHNIKQLLAELVELINNKTISPRTITCINAHIYNIASREQQLRTDILKSRIIAADGMSIVYALRLLSRKYSGSRCNMTDAFKAFISSKDFPDTRAIIIGLSEADAHLAAESINTKSPHCRIVDMINGYLSEDDYRKAISELPDIDLILVGMGTPRSERVVQIAAQLKPEAIVWHIGGGTLEILAGKRKPAPEWMKNTGLQWLHRLGQEPIRLFTRYIFGNPVFVTKLMLDTIRSARSKIKL